MSDSPPFGPSPAGPAPGRLPKSERRTVSRPAGLCIVVSTAALVFASGTSLWPSSSPRPVVAVHLPDPVPAPSAPPRTAGAGGALGEAGSVTSSAGDSGRSDVAPAPATDDGGAVLATDRDVARSAESPQDPRSGNAPLLPSDGSATSPGGEPGKEASAADCALPDKDLARESWRRNWPAICSLRASGKAFILLPIKGPLDGENHALHGHPTREARINLAPGTESLLTMKQYKMNRLGFKEVWVHTGDNGRSHLRVKLLPGAGDPVFEIKDGYAKITVAVSDQN